MSQLLRSQLKFAATWTAPSCARMFVRCTLNSWLLAHLADDAELIVSELVTNAVKATGTDPNAPYTGLRNLAILAVRVRVSGDALVIEVWDGDANEPGEPTEVEELAEGGRGLVIVAALSRRYGVTTLTTGGKIIWSELNAGPKVAAIPQVEPAPLPRGARQVAKTSAASDRRPPLPHGAHRDVADPVPIGGAHPAYRPPGTTAAPQAWE